MIFKESAVVGAMEAGAKGYGYNLLIRCGECIIEGGEWLTVMYMGNMPREVLATIVKHMGYIPEQGCWCIKKTKEGYDVAGFTEDVVAQDLREYMGNREMKVKNTGVTMWGKAIYCCEDGSMLGVTPDTLRLVDSGTFRVCDTGSLTVYDDDGQLWLKTVGREHFNGFDNHMRVWDAMAGLDWWREARTTSADEGEQMEI